MNIRKLYEIKHDIDAFDEDLANYTQTGDGFTEEARVARQILIDEHEEWHRLNSLGIV